jgi:hypothetical protein
MSFDIPEGFTEIVVVEEERLIDVALGFPESERQPRHVLAQYQVSQGNEPVDRDERVSSLKELEGAEVWSTVDWNGEDVEIIVVETQDIRQAHLTVPVMTGAGKQYFGILFQYQVIDDECVPQIQDLFFSILETWQPNPSSSFASS